MQYFCPVFLLLDSVLNWTTTIATNGETIVALHLGKPLGSRDALLQNRWQSESSFHFKHEQAQGACGQKVSLRMIL